MFDKNYDEWIKARLEEGMSELAMMEEQDLEIIEECEELDILWQKLG